MCCSFFMESIFFTSPKVMAKLQMTEQAANIIKPWAFNQGFYNLFFAMGLFYGLYAFNTSQNIIVFILISIVAAGIVLNFSVPGKTSAAVLQVLPALLALILLKLAH